MQQRMAWRDGDVVIAVPGSYDAAADQVRHADRVPAWTSPGISAAVTASLASSARLSIDNDANLALVAESAATHGDGARNRSLLCSFYGVCKRVVEQQHTGDAGDLWRRETQVEPYRRDNQEHVRLDIAQFSSDFDGTKTERSEPQRLTAALIDLFCERFKSLIPSAVQNTKRASIAIESMQDSGIS
jgi:hypothetical protein